MNNRTTAALGLLLCIGTSVGASAEPEPSTRTVSWFLSHPSARAQVNAICKDDPGTARHVPNCINASVADERAALDHISAPTQPSLIQRCAEMPPLFQIVNHCGNSR